MRLPIGPIRGVGNPAAWWSFVDDDGSTHEGGIEAIAAAGLTAGCNPPANDRYCPDANVTREQMAAFIARARQLAVSEEDYFTDDEGHLFERSINSIARARYHARLQSPGERRVLSRQGDDQGRNGSHAGAGIRRPGFRRGLLPR